MSYTTVSFFTLSQAALFTVSNINSLMPVVQSEVPHPIRASGSQYRMTVVQSEVHTQFGPVDRKRKYRAGWWEKGVPVPRCSSLARCKRVILGVRL